MVCQEASQNPVQLKPDEYTLILEKSVGTVRNSAIMIAIEENPGSILVVCRRMSWSQWITLAQCTEE